MRGGCRRVAERSRRGGELERAKHGARVGLRARRRFVDPTAPFLTALPVRMATPEHATPQTDEDFVVGKARVGDLLHVLKEMDTIALGLVLQTRVLGRHEANRVAGSRGRVRRDCCAAQAQTVEGLLDRGLGRPIRRRRRRRSRRCSACCAPCVRHDARDRRMVPGWRGRLGRSPQSANMRPMRACHLSSVVLALCCIACGSTQRATTPTPINSPAARCRRRQRARPPGRSFWPRAWGRSPPSPATSDTPTGERERSPPAHPPVRGQPGRGHRAARFHRDHVDPADNGRALRRVCHRRVGVDGWTRLGRAGGERNRGEAADACFGDLPAEVSRRRRDTGLLGGRQAERQRNDRKEEGCAADLRRPPLGRAGGDGASPRSQHRHAGDTLWGSRDRCAPQLRTGGPDGVAARGRRGEGHWRALQRLDGCAPR